jgi:sulfonate transport system permease protein
MLESARREVLFRGGAFTPRHSRVAGATALMALVLLWQLASSLGWISPVFMPSPWQVALALIGMGEAGELFGHLAASLGRLLGGYAIGMTAGVAFGLSVGLLSVTRSAGIALVSALFPIPKIALLPLFILWFGIGEASKIAFIAYAAFFPIFTTTLEGIKYVDPLLLRAASSLGASQRDLFRYVVLPAALPAIITGLRLGFGLSFFVIVAAEFIAADSGLGYLINDARTFFLVSQMLLGAAVIGLIGFTFNRLLRLLEARLLRWRKPAFSG